MSLCDRLVAFIEGQDLELDSELKETTSLIKSGLMDSLALFNLATWIEGEINSQVDLTAFDISEEWDTVANILSFIEKHCGMMVAGKTETRTKR